MGSTQRYTELLSILQCFINASTPCWNVNAGLTWLHTHWRRPPGKHLWSWFQLTMVTQDMFKRLTS
jgi:hypothetical protein